MIAVSYRGHTTAADLRACTSAAIAMSTKCGSRHFLVDTTEIVAALSNVALYSLAKTTYFAEQLHPLSCVAVVLPAREEERDLANFYETVCLNHGWRVQLFQNGESARRWLLEDAGR